MSGECIGNALAFAAWKGMGARHTHCLLPSRANLMTPFESENMTVKRISLLLVVGATLNVACADESGLHAGSDSSAGAADPVGNDGGGGGNGVDGGRAEGGHGADSGDREGGGWPVVDGGLLGSAPHGIFALGTQSSAPNLLELPFVDGVLIRVRWSQLQPTSQTEYDWSAIDTQLKQAEAAGKKASIAVLLGTFSTSSSAVPNWVFDSAGVQKWITAQGYTYADPMDPKFWQMWTGFVQAFGAKYNGNPTVEQVGICGGTGSLCGLRFAQLPASWDDSFMLTQWKTLVDLYASQFPSTRLHYEVQMTLPSSQGQDPLRLATAMHDYIVAKYEPHVGPFVDFLSNTQPAGGVLTLMKTWQSASGWCGAQEVSAQGANLDAAYAHAHNDMGCSYVEIYESDLTNPSYTSTNTNWHSTLHP